MINVYYCLQAFEKIEQMPSSSKEAAAKGYTFACAAAVTYYEGVDLAVVGCCDWCACVDVCTSIGIYIHILQYDIK